MVTVQFVSAVAFSLVLFVMAANVLVDLYVRAAVRDAIDEAVRVAVPAGTPAQRCTDRAAAAIASLVRGPIARDVVVRCVAVGGWVQADADVRLPSFVPILVPGWNFHLHARARQEQF